MKKGQFLKTYTIVSSVIILLLMGVSVYFDMTKEISEIPYFFLHFAKPICLVLIGTIAMVLPKIPVNSYAGGSQKGDKIMPYIGIALIVFAFIMLIISF